MEPAHNQKAYMAGGGKMKYGKKVRDLFERKPWIAEEVDFIIDAGENPTKAEIIKGRRSWLAECVLYIAERPLDNLNLDLRSVSESATIQGYSQFYVNWGVEFRLYYRLPGEAEYCTESSLSVQGNGSTPRDIIRLVRNTYSSVELVGFIIRQAGWADPLGFPRYSYDVFDLPKDFLA